MASITLDQPNKFRIGRVFNDSFAVIGRNPVLCLGLALIFSALPRFVFALWFRNSVTNVEHGGPEFSVQRVALTVVGAIGYIVLISLLEVALTRAAIEDLSGKRPSMRDCIGTALALLLPAIGISLIVNIGFTAGLVLLVVPGFLLLVLWVVATPVLVQEKLGVFASLGRSRDLSKGSRWSLLGLWFPLFAALVAINFALGRILSHLGIPLGFFLDALGRAVEQVVFSVAAAVSYVELRQVKEGTSVEELSEIFS
ncbi:hypothetical protein RQ479_08925 [Mesorhizobium sp. ISC25]|uniref:hypothetical protein n=1 Tax=Mesorhizobium sp. ISC25 TaxID=3077335 RepID=UPI0035DCB00C